ncbi:Periplasmic binding protein [Burkholderiales bacterium 8X]|nr:Periplasmic binding protein [Burkholderiales bacterium 8X]
MSARSFGASRRKVLRVLAAAALGASAAAALAQTSRPDRSGRAARQPRLVTVGGAITEIVYLLGVEEQLVGTDSTSLYPDPALRTPKVGYQRALSAEGLLSLRPDAIIATTEAGPPVVLDQVRSAGVKVELIASDHSWAEVQRKVAAVGRAAGREAAARELQARLDGEWAEVQRLVEASPVRRPKVLFVLSHSGSPQVSGSGTAADAVIRFAGGINCMTGFQGYRPMTAEAMASAAPDLILTSSQSIDAHGGAAKFWDRPELALTPAFRKRSLVTQDALLLLGFGPRLPGAIRELHARMREA